LEVRNKKFRMEDCERNKLFKLIIDRDEMINGGIAVYVYEFFEN
jgi:hypothetical protein